MSKEDKNWIDAAKALERLGARNQSVLAPMGFDFYFKNVVVYDEKEKFFNKLNSIIVWFVVYKPNLKSLSKHDLISVLIDSRIIYSNEEFSIFMLPPNEQRCSGGVLSFLRYLS